MDSIGADLNRVWVVCLLLAVAAFTVTYFIVKGTETCIIKSSRFVDQDGKTVTQSLKTCE